MPVGLVSWLICIPSWSCSPFFASKPAYQRLEAVDALSFSFTLIHCLNCHTFINGDVEQRVFPHGANKLSDCICRGILLLVHAAITLNPFKSTCDPVRQDLAGCQYAGPAAVVGTRTVCIPASLWCPNTMYLQSGCATLSVAYSCSALFLPLC